MFDDKKFDLFEHDFIKISSLNFELPEHNGSWIFTSQNAVNAVFSISKNINLIFDKIYCVGENTKSILSKHGQNKRIWICTVYVFLPKNSQNVTKTTIFP